MQFEMIGAPVGIDDEIGRYVGPGRFDEDMNALVYTTATHRIANDPAHGVPGRYRPRSHQLLAFLQHDVGDLPWRGINLIKRAIGIGVLLDRVQIAAAIRLHPCSGIGATDALARVTRRSNSRPGTGWHGKARCHSCGEHEREAAAQCRAGHGDH